MPRDRGSRADHPVWQVRAASGRQPRRSVVDAAWTPVGRGRELALLVEQMAGLEWGEPAVRLVEVTGDAGIGKTVLLNEFAGAARDRGAMVLAGWRTGQLPGQPFGVFADAFVGHEQVFSMLADWPATRGGEAAGRGNDGEPADRRGGSGEGSGESGQAASSGPAEPFGAPFWSESKQFCEQSGLGPCAAYAAVRELIEGFAAPVTVVILDDLHLADEYSLKLVADLLRYPPKVSLLFVLGFRDRQAGALLRSIVDGAAPQIAPVRVHLEALSEDALGSILADHGIASWRRQLYERSWGNPAYLKVLINELLPAPGPAVLPGPQQGARPGHYAPFVDELAALTPRARAVADAAAVVGWEFDVELVARMLCLDESATFASIGELVRHDLVRPMASGTYFTFRHPVVHRAVYHGIELSRRVQLHCLADVALQARGATAIERAPHVEQSAKHGDLDAVDVLEAAARGVTRPATAAEWLTTALRLLPGQPDHQGRRAQLLIRLAKARGSAGDLRECRDIMHLALPLLPRHPPAGHANAVAYTAMAQRLLGSHPETEAMLLAEVRSLGDTDPAGMAALLFEIAARDLDMGRWAACVGRAEQSLALARELDSHSRQLSCHGLIAKASVVGGQFDQAAHHLARATAMLDRMLDGDFVYSLDSVVWIGWSYALLERWDDALRLFNKAVAFADRAGRLLALPHLLVGQVFALYNSGRLAEAHAAADYAVYFVQVSGSPEQLIGAYSALAWTDAITGRLDRGLESIEVAVGQLDGPIGGFGVLALRLLAEARLITGDPEGCLDLATTMIGPELMSADVCSRVAWYELLTRAELALGRPKEAGLWADAATETAAQLDQRGRNALARLAQAQVQLVLDPEKALDSADLAFSGLTAARMPIDALRARMVLGIALWHHDRYGEAVRELRVAQTELERLGAVTLAKQALTERRRLSARTSRKRDGERTGGVVSLLTERERQIADLVRDGLTNRRIARALHISEKTVEMHLSKVFSKLGLSNRAAVAAFISQAPAVH